MGFVHYFHSGHVLCCWGKLGLNTLLCKLKLCWLFRTSIGDRYRKFGSFGNQEVEHLGQLVFFVLGV